MPYDTGKLAVVADGPTESKLRKRSVIEMLPIQKNWVKVKILLMSAPD